MTRVSGRKRAVGALLAVAALAAFLSRGPAPETSAADHRDGPILVNTATQGTKDINDIYVFRSPANANNTVFFFSFQPFPGNLTPRSVDPTQQFDIKIDTSGDAVEDTIFRLTFGAPDANGVQDVTLRGLPAAPCPGTAVIPPSPRANLARGERRNAFNAAQPKNHRAPAPLGFRDDMIFVLTDPNGFFKRTQADASFLADALLPDLLMFQIGNPNGFGTTIGPGPGFFTGPFPGGQVLGNGRRFADDVTDIMFNLLTNGVIPSDNVGDDNGLKVTDGSVDPVSGKTRAIAFPYVGLANLPLNGPGTGPNP